MMIDGRKKIDWEKMIAAAMDVCNPRKLSASSYAGSVGAALMSDSGKIYTGVCIDTPCSMGFCAEHAAAAAMVTAGENKIVAIVAVHMTENGSYESIPLCGRCREFLCQLHDENEKALVFLNGAIITLEQMLPFRWKP